MSRVIDIDPANGLVILSFAYDADVVQTVRSLPDRQFDPATRQWSVPTKHTAEVIETLEPLSFHHSPRFRVWWAANSDLVQTAPAEHLTISDLNREIRQRIRQAFPSEIWVVGELQGYDRNTKKNVWFELVERDGDEAKARVDAFMFEADARRVMDRLAQDSPDICWRDGLMVRVRVKPDFFESGGRFQLQIRDVDPTYTAGALNAQRDRVLRQLVEEGIATNNVDLPMPICPLRVGVITSAGSDAYNDIIHELVASGFSFAITLAPATMQGAQTESSVLSALRWFYRRAADFDVLIISRGGGARSDLAWFDSHAIARAVCVTPIKIVTGVGHHRDKCVLDFISTSVKTPTAAAQTIVEAVREFEAAVANLGKAGARAAEHALQRAGRRLDTWSHRLSSSAARQVHHSSKRLANLERDLWSSARTGIRVEDEAQRARTERLHTSAKHALSAEEHRVETASIRLKLLDPKQVLKRGYVMVRSQGSVVSSGLGLAKAKHAELEFFDSRVAVKVTGVVANPNKNGDES